MHKNNIKCTKVFFKSQIPVRNCKQCKDISTDLQLTPDQLFELKDIFSGSCIDKNNSIHNIKVGDF